MLGAKCAQCSGCALREVCVARGVRGNKFPRYRMPSLRDSLVLVAVFEICFGVGDVVALEELLHLDVKRLVAVSLLLPFDITPDRRCPRITYREGCVSFLPSEVVRQQLRFVQPIRGCPFDVFDNACQGGFWTQANQQVDVIFDAVDRKEHASVPRNNRANIPIKLSTNPLDKKR